MADRSGPDLTSPDLHVPIVEDGEMNSKKKRMNELMEALRNRKGRVHSWIETTKVLRMSVTDKRHQIDSVEKHNLTKHLSVLQQSFKVTGFVAMLERLELMCLALAVKYTKHSISDLLSVFITCDVFNVEIILDNKGIVKDVKIYHGSEPVHCAELVKLLNDSNFEAFKEHLQGIMAIYNISGDKKQRMKAFTALQALETDLNNLSKLQSAITSVPSFIHKTPLGILIPRVAGTLMRMVYFVGPYDLLDRHKRTTKAMTIEGITENNLGHSVTVCIEASNKLHKLQTMPLMTVKTHEGKTFPSFTPFNNMNCSELNAVFVLKLHHKMALSLSTIKAIASTTGMKFDDQLSIKPFWEVLVEAVGVDPSDSVSVNLPDQVHSYYLGGPTGSSADQLGAMVEKIPFIHPTHVPKIIAYLRQQAIYNTVLSSCLRHKSHQDLGRFLTFEVLPISLQVINVTFEHPYTDAITTAEFDMSDLTSLRCHICSSHMDGKGHDSKPVEICTDEFATKIFQRCLSLPVTLRSMFCDAYHKMELYIPPPLSPPPVKKSERLRLFSLLPPQVQHRQHFNKLPVLSSKGQARRAAFLESYRENKMISLNNPSVTSLNSVGGSLLTNFTLPSDTVTTTASTAVPPPSYQHYQGVTTTTSNKQALSSVVGMPHINSRENGNSSRDTAVVSPEVVHAYESGYADPSQAPKEVLDAIKKDKISKNPMLASLLDQERESPEPTPQQSMLSTLLGESNSQVTTMPAHSNSNNVNPMAVPSKQPNYNNQLPNQMHQQPQHVTKKERKRKSTGDGTNSSVSNMYGQLPINNSNVMIGRSPKRLHSEEESFNQFSFSSISSAESDPSHNLNHPMGTNHPLAGMVRGNTLDVLTQGPPLPPQQQNNANFHSQTRVGGTNPMLPVVSSSVVMVTESNSPVNHSSNSLSSTSLSFSTSHPQQSDLSRTTTSQAHAHNPMLISPLASSAAATPKFTEESPVFRLASTIDNIMVKQEAKTISSNLSSADSFVTSGSVDSLQGYPPKNCFVKVDGNHKKINSINSSSVLSDIKLENSIKYESSTSHDAAVIKKESLKNCDITVKSNVVAGRAISIDDIKKEDQIPLQMDCEDIPNPIKDRTSVVNSVGLKGGASHQSSIGNYKRSKSIEHDPFEFNDNVLDQSGSSMDGFDTDQADIWEVVTNDKQFSNSTSSSSTLSKITTAKYNSKDKFDTYEIVKSDNHIHSKKERKKSSRVDSKEYFVEDSKKPMLGTITVKINAKEGSAKAYVKQSPLHRSESPQDLEFLPSRKIKDSKMSSLKQGSVTPDRASDISTDSDVFVITPDSGLHKSGLHNNISSRILSGKKLGSERGSSNSGTILYKEKKKKSSKSMSGDSKHEKKRKRNEEAMKKDQLKKQKVYDFDFNESEHLPPTKIKIRTSSDGKVQIQTGSMKTYSMSPLPMKVDSELKASPSSSSSVVKRHRSEKSNKQKKDKSEKYNRSKSEPQGAKLDKSDSKLYGRTPVVKIKPLENSGCSSVSVAVSTPSTLTNKSITASQMPTIPIVKVSVSPLVTTSHVTTPIIKNSNKLSGISVSKLTTDSGGVRINKNTSFITDSSVKTKQLSSSDLNTLKNKTLTNEITNAKIKASSNSVESSAIKSKSSSSGTDTNYKNKAGSVSESSSYKSKQVITNSESSAKSNKQVLNSEMSKTKQSTNTGKNSAIVPSATSNESSSNVKSKSSSDIERKRPSSTSGVHSNSTDTPPAKSKLSLPLVNSSGSGGTSESVSTKNRLQSEKNGGSHSNLDIKHNKNKLNHGNSSSEKDSSTVKSKYEKTDKVSTSSNDTAQSSKIKSDKSTSSDAQKKQRKGSLSAVIDKLKQSRNKTEAEPKKAQDVYDEIRHAILKAGTDKSSTPPIGKIGKISKQDSTTNSSQNSGNKSITPTGNKSLSAKTANAVLDSILPKPSPTGSSFRIPKSSSSSNNSNVSNNTSSSKTDSVDTSSKSKSKDSYNTNNPVSQATAITSSNPKNNQSHITNNSMPNHVVQKSGISNHVMRQNSRDNSNSGDKSSKKAKIDDISEKLQSRHFLDAVGSMPPKDGATDSGISVDKKNSSSQFHNKMDTKVQQNSDNKSNLRPDNLAPPSKGGEQRTRNSQYNSDQTRSKSPVVNSAKPLNNKQSIGNSNKTSSINNFRNNQIYNNNSGNSSQKNQQNRPRTPVERPRTPVERPRTPVERPRTPVESKIQTHHSINNIIEPKTVNNRDPRSASQSQVTGSITSSKSDLNVPSSRSSVGDNISSVPSTSSISSNVVHVSEAASSNPSGKPQMFYNPAEALGRKSGSSFNSSTSDIIISKSSSNISSKKDSADSNKLPPPLKAPIIIPLVNTSSESPASPVDKPGLTIRHDTPPASPIMGGVDVSDNKENVVAAKSIPLDDSKTFKAPIPKVSLKNEDSGKCKIGMSSSSGGSCEKPASDLVNKGDLKPILSPNSEISSPEDSLAIDCSSVQSAPPGKAPVTIPLERSRSRSPADRSRSPLTPRSPVQGHISKTRSSPERSRSPLTPRSPAPIQSPSPKDMSVKSPINKFHKPGSPCKAVKSPLAQISSPGSRPSSCNSIEDDDLMNEALTIKYDH